MMRGLVDLVWSFAAMILCGIGYVLTNWGHKEGEPANRVAKWFWIKGMWHSQRIRDILRGTM